ncbi:MAG: hypothetical protein ACLUI5_08080 [Fusicatenibacter saccharivorans]
MFQKGPFLKDQSHDFLPDALDVKLVLPEDASDAMFLAACDLAYRFGMETTGYEGTILAEAGYKGNQIIFEKADQTELVLGETDGDGVKVYLRGDGEALTAFTARLCNTFPKICGERSWKDLLMDMVDDFILRGEDGQLAELKALQEKKAAPMRFTDRRAGAKSRKKRPEMQKFTITNPVRKCTRKYMNSRGRSEVFEELLETEVYPKLKEGSTVKITGAVSETESVRRKMCEAIDAKIREAGAVPEQTTIYCAYKQGYSWLAEEMLPRLKEAGADTVTVYFKPFLPEGQTEWNDENRSHPVLPQPECRDAGQMVRLYRSVICRSCTRSRIFW